jgi:hypothetical protein
MECHVLRALAKATIDIGTCHLWMLTKGFDTFALVMNYIDEKWEMCHIIINIFQVHETSKDNKVIQIKDLFSCYNSCDNEITYVKDKKTSN